jgi:hypothetical protein
MTGVEALQALREGKKVTHEDYKPYHYLYVIEYTMNGKPYKEIACVGTWEPGPVDPMMWCGGDPVNVTYFLQDDWEIVE